MSNINQLVLCSSLVEEGWKDKIFELFPFLKDIPILNRFLLRPTQKQWLDLGMTKDDIAYILRGTPTAVKEIPNVMAHAPEIIDTAPRVIKAAYNAMPPDQKENVISRIIGVICSSVVKRNPMGIAISHSKFIMNESKKHQEFLMNEVI